jgi:two-component system chemotaxis response regulator CheY
MSIARVLIVDDSKTSRKLLRSILENADFEVIGEAVDGEEGWLMSKELKPDIVTMDITMPKMDGIESLSLIKRDNEDVRVIMISASGQREKMVEALKRGADDFLVKPFDPDKVARTLSDAVNGGDEG